MLANQGNVHSIRRPRTDPPTCDARLRSVCPHQLAQNLRYRRANLDKPILEHSFMVRWSKPRKPLWLVWKPDSGISTESLPPNRIIFCLPVPQRSRIRSKSQTSVGALPRSRHGELGSIRIPELLQDPQYLLERQENHNQRWNRHS